ncbi:hypothetical protein LSAT2_001475 [Lamellibrachia satsuma]|nr:hypothetical protein LSAT2_001475 [Lamellibrachia satsuma]
MDGLAVCRLRADWGGGVNKEYPRLNVGFSAVGPPSGKWTEHNLECGCGSQFFPASFSCLFKSFIHVRRPSGSFRSVGNGEARAKPEPAKSICCTINVNGSVPWDVKCNCISRAQRGDCETKGQAMAAECNYTCSLRRV